MKRVHPVVLLLLGLLLGAVITGLTGFHYSLKFLARSSARTACTELADAHQVLQWVRKGDTNKAIESLEFKRDSAVISLGALVEAGVDDPRHKGAYLRLLKRVSQYRSAYPPKTELPELDREVAAVLSWVGRQPEK